MTADWQKKQVTAPWGLNIFDMFPQGEEVGRGAGAGGRAKALRHERAREVVASFAHSTRPEALMHDAPGLRRAAANLDSTVTAMSTAAGPSANRGDLILQPSYFTSSLYVEPLREDLTTLVNLFAQRYVETWPPSEPFALFKRIWSEQGWCWLHFRVLDARSRETFINVTERIFVGEGTPR